MVKHRLDSDEEFLLSVRGRTSFILAVPERSRFHASTFRRQEGIAHEVDVGKSFWAFYSTNSRGFSS